MTGLNTGILVLISLSHNLPYATPGLLKPWPLPPMRYVDRSHSNKDIFFDRIVFLTLDIKNFFSDNKTYYNIATGVLLKDDLVLTSYNPFRNLTKSADIVSKIYVCFVTLRLVQLPDTTAYDYQCATIACGRQVIPLPNELISRDQWHGVDQEHSPLHDLMVVKLDEALEIWKPEKDYTYEERHSEAQIKANTIQTAGPLLTNIAVAADNISMPVKFACLDLTSVLYFKANHALESVEYYESDKIITDCEDWLPRNWGYFICLWNDPDFSGFTSGAMLFSNKTLFGVGSFTLWRGRDSVLVFTDVRPYNELIMNTCSKADLEI